MGETEVAAADALAALARTERTGRAKGLRILRSLAAGVRAELASGGPYTREQIASVCNAAADAALPGEDEYETSGTIAQTDECNLFVNLAMGWIDEPGATADEIIEASYSEPAETVWGWVL